MSWLLRWLSARSPYRRFPPTRPEGTVITYPGGARLPVEFVQEGTDEDGTPVFVSRARYCRGCCRLSIERAPDPMIVLFKALHWNPPE